MNRRKFFRLAVVASAACIGVGTAADAYAQMHRAPHATHGHGPRMAPPAKRFERRPLPPRGNYVWADGNWRWDGSRYVWTSGRWMKSRPGHHWTPGA